MSRELLQQALDALKYHTEHTYPFHLTNVAIEFLAKELAKPEQELQMIRMENGKFSYIKKPWVGLTDDEIHKIIDDCTSDEAGQEELNDFAKAVRFAENKLKEKNNAV